MGIIRFFHSSFHNFNVNSSPIAVLRKKTGYGLSNIRKALALNDNNIDKAEKWLAEQAKALGWNKFIKLQERETAQGLIGIAVKEKKLAVVEVNCETDFVSRNDKFKSFVELVTKTCLKLPVLTSELDTHKIYYDSEEIGKLKTENSNLADEMALFIGSVGENVKLKQAFCYETLRNDVDIAVAVHPPSQNSEVLLGKYGAFISYQKTSDPPVFEDTSDVLNDICTHIIGANPSKIGEYGKDEPSENDNETVLIHQDFLLNDSVTVGQLLTDSGLVILDFKRFQCGQSQDDSNKSSDSPECNDNQNLNEVQV